MYARVCVIRVMQQRLVAEQRWMLGGPGATRPFFFTNVRRAPRRSHGEVSIDQPNLRFQAARPRSVRIKAVLPFQLSLSRFRVLH
jgi:hypothetical protein